jgi:hypothetical protein
MTTRYPTHTPSARQASRLALLAAATLLSSLLGGCAQRVHISDLHAMSYKRIFSAQAVAPDAQLASLNSEDSKGLIKRREKRKDAEATASARSSSAASRAARQFSLGGR